MRLDEGSPSSLPVRPRAVIQPLARIPATAGGARTREPILRQSTTPGGRPTNRVITGKPEGETWNGMYDNIKYRRDILGQLIPEHDVMRSMQREEVYKTGDREAVVTSHEGIAKTGIPEGGSFSRLMTKMEGKI